MPEARRDIRWSALFALTLAGTLPWSTAALGCDLPAGPRDRVVDIVDGRTLALESGVRVRLAGIAVADPAAAAALLGRQALGRDIELRYGGTRRDRHGRALAQVFRLGEGPPVWLQAALVSAGVAYVQSFNDNRACIGELLVREDAARRNHFGAWRKGGISVDRAERPAALSGAADRFRIVEGRIVSTGQTRRWTYLNFGRVWRSDFTGLVRARDRALFVAAGLDPAGLVGRRVRLRGWLEQRGGPAMVIDHPEQIELIDGRERVE